ncbi:MAG: 5'/3'-nucleotidase SurE [Candidatus Hodarchaeales archaeon]
MTSNNEGTNLQSYKILLSNDDGIDSPGLISLVKVLQASKEPRFDIKVVAPSTQQTATGKSMSFNKPVRAFQKQVTDELQGIAVEGTPADTVVMGIRKYHPDVDFVVSGINAGENTSIHSMFTSGTLAVCLEASLGYGLPGWAFSLDMDSKYFFRTTEEQSLNDYDNAAKKSLEIMSKVLFSGGFPDGVSFMNVNFPKGLTNKTPIRITKPSINKYANIPVEEKDPRGIPFYWVWGNLIDPEPETDTECIKKKHEISITPYHLQKLQEIDGDQANNLKKVLQ